MMRANEFIRENASVGGTSAGNVATVAQPLSMQTRNGGSFFTGKYMNSADPYPNTPAYMKKGKKSRAK